MSTITHIIGFFFKTYSFLMLFYQYHLKIVKVACILIVNQYYKVYAFVYHKSLVMYGSKAIVRCLLLI